MRFTDKQKEYYFSLWEMGKPGKGFVHYQHAEGILQPAL